MATAGSALSTRKGWAVASLFRKAREHIQLKNLARNGGLILVSLWLLMRHMQPVPIYCRHRIPPLPGTFGHGSSL
jgi:hypothetical protein